MATVRTFWEFAKRVVARNMAYRANVPITVLRNILRIFVQVAIWSALLRQGAMQGITVSDMLTYVVLSNCLSMIMVDGVAYMVDDRLRTGSIAMDLLKPVSYPLFVGANAAGDILFRVAFMVAPTLLTAILAVGLQGPTSSIHLLAFLGATAVAAALSFCIAILVGLCAFWFLQAWHFDWFLGGISGVLSGAWVPLWFFPDWLARVAQWLPFQQLSFVPSAIYLGKIPAAEIGGHLLQGVLWIAALSLVCALLWRRAVRRLVIQGG